MTKTAKTAKTAAISSVNADFVIAQIGWHRFLIARNKVQDLFDVFTGSQEIERDYSEGEGYSYIKGPVSFTVSTPNEEIEIGKREPAIEKDDGPTAA